MAICDGLTVVEGGSGSIAASMLGMVLADNGARVLKLEPPDGDLFRATNPNGFMVWNRGKDSVVCDLETEGGRRQARGLLASADVFVDAYPNGDTDRWALDHEALARANAGLVTCAVRAFASTGPYADLPALDSIVAAKAGRFTDARVGHPRYPNEYLASHGAAHMGVASVLAALIVRDRTGLGQRVEVSLYEGLSPFDYFGVSTAQAARLVASPPALPGVALANMVPCTKDGRWAVICSMLPHQAQAVARACGLGHLNDDARFAGAPRFQSQADAEEYERLVWEAVRELTAAELAERLAGEPDAACEIAATTPEAMDHPQVVNNSHVAIVDDPRRGPVEQIGPVARFLASPSRIGRAAPALGDSRGVEVPAPPVRGTEPLPEHPLDGVTIVEFGYFYAMPNATSMAAALGARVIKIEDQRGDPQRWSFGIRETGSAKAMEGKDSLAIDLRKPEGQAVLHRILRDADVFVCGFRPGVAEKMNLGHDTLRAVNPRLVYLHAGGYGFDGPYALRAMYAPIATAVGGGFHRQSGTWLDPGHAAGRTIDELREHLAPRITSLVGGDAHASLAVLSALLLAIYHQRRAGEGQFVSTTMLNGNLYAACDDFLRHPDRAPLALLDPEAWGLHALDRCYPASEGHVVVAAPTEEAWRALASALDRGDLVTDPRFGDAAARAAHDAVLAAVLAEVFANRPAREWEAVLVPKGIACVEVTETSPSTFTIEDAGLRASGLTYEIDDPSFGRVVRHGPPAHFSLTPARIAAPCLTGQHTVSILREWGYSDDEIGRLEQAGVVFDQAACSP